MAVIALAALVIEAHQAFPGATEEQAVLVSMLGRRNAFRNGPYPHLDDRTIGEDSLVVDDQPSF
jgi:hypothetical protein